VPGLVVLRPDVHLKERAVPYFKCAILMENIALHIDTGTQYQ